MDRKGIPFDEVERQIMLKVFEDTSEFRLSSKQ